MRAISFVDYGLTVFSAQGIRCDSGNPSCSQYTSTGWNSNKPPDQKHSRRAIRVYDSAQTLTYLVHTWDGTHRERQSLHFFCLFSAPELAGSLDSEFWQVRLPQATLYDHAVKHAVAAIGAAHEYQLRKQAARDNTRTKELHSFALRQCNKSIQDLIRPSKGRYQGLVRAMTASVLFACFENINRQRGQAVVHVQHCNKILAQLKALRKRLEAHSEGEAMPINFELLEPLIAHYGYQNDHYILAGQVEEDTTDLIEYDLDESGRPVFKTLGDARIMLTGAIARLSVEIVKLEDSKRTAKDVADVALTKSRYSDFLWRWDLSFGRFLNRPGKSLRSADLDGCRILRAHLLAGSTLADINFVQGEQGWGIFEARYKTIVQLLEEVSGTLPTRTVSLEAPQEPHLSATMGPVEPLYLVATRSLDITVAQRARVLLAKLPLNEGAQSKWRIDFMERILCACTGRPFVADSSERLSGVKIA